MATRESIQRKKDHAKLLYTVEGVTEQKELAQRAGVSEQTICKWIKKEKWKTYRAANILSRDEQLNRIFEQISELNASIEKRPEGKKFPDAKEADTLVKLSAAAKSLENNDTSTTDRILVMKAFIQYVRDNGPKVLDEVLKLSDEFVKVNI